MLIRIPSVLTKEELVQCRLAFAQSEWIDGRATAGAQSAEAKHNLQLPEGSLQARQLGELNSQGAGAESAVQCGCPALACLPAALQSL